MLFATERNAVKLLPMTTELIGYEIRLSNIRHSIPIPESGVFVTAGEVPFFVSCLHDWARTEQLKCMCNDVDCLTCHSFGLKSSMIKFCERFVREDETALKLNLFIPVQVVLTYCYFTTISERYSKK